LLVGVRGLACLKEINGLVESGTLKRCALF
jgi:hypothetical protein